MSVTFCVGNVGIKRRSFLERRPATVTVDNDDILLNFRLGGKLYCALGSIPFADLSVRDYVAYTRALVSPRMLNDGEIRYILREAGFTRGLYARVGSLSRVEYRHLALASRLQIDTRAVEVNFDGLEYTARHRRQLYRMLRALDRKYAVRVAVTDTRFIPRFAETLQLDETGVKRYGGKDILSRPAPKSAILRRFRAKDIPLCGDNVKKILVIG